MYFNAQEKRLLEYKKKYVYHKTMIKKHIVWFEEIDKNDTPFVGGKGANLGEMVNADLPIPYGFIVTAPAYFYFLNQSNLAPKIKQILSNINYEDQNQLTQVSKEIKNLILKAKIPIDLSKRVIKYYDTLTEKQIKINTKKMTPINQITAKLKNIYSPPIVAVRSSATAEDLPTASFAGQQESYLNVQGETQLLKKIKECWASLFTERAIYYRHQQGFDHFKVGLAAVVQKMVQSQKSGIAFSIDPVTNDKRKIVIEAIYGLGEYIVQGKVTPDHYEIDKKSLVITKKEIKTQKIKYIKFNKTNKELKIPPHIGKEQKISDIEIIELAILVKKIEDHYYFPQDIEWAIEKDRVYIVQSRPITTTKTKKTSKIQIKKEEPILIGAPASPGIGVGKPTIIFSPKEINKIKKGNILVAPSTNPDYVPAMKRAKAIVTERGGRTSHAAIVSRELGIPAVVGVENATKVLKRQTIISVNGSTGEIFKGSIISNQTQKKEIIKKHTKTRTKIYTNLAEPDQAKKISKMNVDGIGLLRAEFMIADIGIHPKKIIQQKKQKQYIEQLYTKLHKFVKNFNPRQVIYRATDFKTNEYRHLKGGRQFEPQEENPMLGFRGASRYIANPEVFAMELTAIKKIWQQGYKNLHLMIPFIRVPWELIQIKTIIKNHGLYNYPQFKLWIMVEVPSCALNLEEFIKIGIDGISIGTNDLTMMLLGVDRDNEMISDIYDERNAVIINVLKNIVTTCKNNNITSSICGQAASDYPEIIETLVKAGITSLSVTPDAINRTRELVKTIEQDIKKTNSNK